MKIKAKAIIAGLLMLSATMVTLVGCNSGTEADTKADQVIKIGSDSYPPFNYLDEDGVSTGIDIDLAREAFARMGYEVEIVYIDWEEKTELLENGNIDCIWGCFSMDGRFDDYDWAGPYMVSSQVIAVKPESNIYSISDLQGKNVAVQSTTKPEAYFLNKDDDNVPELNSLISLGKRELMYSFLAKDYVDALAAHETSIRQYVKDYNVELRIIDEPLMTVGIGVAFSKNDTRGICEELDKTLEEMKQDGSSEEIIGKYLDNPEKYLEVEQLGY